MVNNNEKILKALENKNESISTTELANITGISIKNISRYLKALENKHFIVRNTIQEGKLRIVMNKLDTTFSEEEIALANLGKGNDFLEIKPIKIEELNPPKTITIKKVPEEVLTEIEFQKIANSSEFKRLVYLIWFGKTHRGKSTDLERLLVKRKREITAINEIGRGTHQDFKSVVSELKETLAKRKIIVDQE